LRQELLTIITPTIRSNKCRNRGLRIDLGGYKHINLMPKHRNRRFKHKYWEMQHWSIVLLIVFSVRLDLNVHYWCIKIDWCVIYIGNDIISVQYRYNDKPSSIITNVWSKLQNVSSLSTENYSGFFSYFQKGYVSIITLHSSCTHS
jgi:hypothetical protein